MLDVEIQFKKKKRKDGINQPYGLRLTAFRPGCSPRPPACHTQLPAASRDESRHHTCPCPANPAVLQLKGQFSRITYQTV